MKKWYEDFFFGVVLDFWEEIVPPELTRRETKLIEKVLKLTSGASLLDIPCGQGRNALPLAKKGYRLTGVDISGESILRLNRSAARLGVPITGVKSNLLKLKLKGRYDGAFCLGNSFAYFDGHEMHRFLGKVSGLLRPKARFLIHSGMFAECLLPNFQERDWVVAGDMAVLMHHRYQVDQGAVQTRYLFFRKGLVEERNSIHWVYTIAQIENLLRAAGFEVAALYGSTRMTEYQVGDPELYMVAEKRR